MTAARVDEFGVYRCTTDKSHRLVTVAFGADNLQIGCTECSTVAWTRLGSSTWYDNHGNLALLIGWQDDHMPARDVRYLVEKPWKFEDEFLAAKACADHEFATGHQVNRDPDGDCLWYCNDCPRRHGYDHEHCTHDLNPKYDDSECCVCDAMSPCQNEQDRAAQEDRDPERVSA